MHIAATPGKGKGKVGSVCTGGFCFSASVGVNMQGKLGCTCSRLIQPPEHNPLSPVETIVATVGVNLPPKSMYRGKNPTIVTVTRVAHNICNGGSA